jgi:hypothetical protein
VGAADFWGTSIGLPGLELVFALAAGLGFARSRHRARR